jgi:hypothetical protein
VKDTPKEIEERTGIPLSSISRAQIRALAEGAEEKCLRLSALKV